MESNKNFENCILFSDNTVNSLDKYYSDREFVRFFSETKNFAEADKKAAAKEKVQELKKEQTQEKDPKKKASLAKRIAKWTAIAAGAAGAAYLGDRWANGGQGMDAIHKGIDNLKETQFGKDVASIKNKVGDKIDDIKQERADKQWREDHPDAKEGETRQQYADRKEEEAKDAAAEKERKENYPGIKPGQSTYNYEKEQEAREKAEEAAKVEAERRKGIDESNSKLEAAKQKHLQQAREQENGGGVKGKIERGVSDVAATVSGGVKNAFNRAANWFDGGKRSESNIVTSEDRANARYKNINDMYDSKKKHYSSISPEDIKLFSDSNENVCIFSRSTVESLTRYYSNKEFIQFFSETKNFSDDSKKELAKGKVETLKNELNGTKDPAKRKSLIKRIAKWTAVAAGLALTYKAASDFGIIDAAMQKLGGLGDEYHRLAGKSAEALGQDQKAIEHNWKSSNVVNETVDNIKSAPAKAGNWILKKLNDED